MVYQKILCPVLIVEIVVFRSLVCFHISPLLGKTFSMHTQGTFCLVFCSEMISKFSALLLIKFEFGRELCNLT